MIHRDSSVCVSLSNSSIAVTAMLVIRDLSMPEITTFGGDGSLKAAIKRNFLEEDQNQAKDHCGVTLMGKRANYI